MNYMTSWYVQWTLQSIFQWISVAPRVGNNGRYRFMFIALTFLPIAILSTPKNQFMYILHCAILGLITVYTRGSNPFSSFHA